MPMDETQIQAVLDSLVRRHSSWIADLPARYTFHGKPVTMEISASGGPTKEMLDLAGLILAHLERILVQAEQEFVAYCAKVDPDLDSIEAYNHILISEDRFRYGGPQAWCFEVLLPEFYEYGTHLEFEGTEFDYAWDGA